MKKIYETPMTSCYDMEPEVMIAASLADVFQPDDLEIGADTSIDGIFESESRISEEFVNFE